MSQPLYIATVSSDVLRYVMNYVSGNDGCIQSITATFQPSGQSVTAQPVTGSSYPNVGFFLQRGAVSQGLQVQIIFYSTSMPANTFQIFLSLTSTNGNTYQLAFINTVPPNNNYAVVVVVQLIFTVQPSQFINVTNLLNAMTYFASNQCQTPPPPQITYSGQGFVTLFEFTNLSNNTLNSVLVAQNTSSNQSDITINMSLVGITVATATISVPPNEYAYFLFALTAELTGG
jgi:hypothetical protein